jgi:peptidoglycan/LPS O-acetylase OafA/YrhL
MPVVVTASCSGKVNLRPSENSINQAQSASAFGAPTADTRPASHIAYRRDIDGLRAIAVGFVLIFHAFPRFLPGGFVGVDIFFVISGFLITKVILADLERDRFSIANFYVRRVRRIFPALLVVLLACLAFGWKTLLAEDLSGLAKHVFGGAIFSSNLFLWHEVGYFDKASETKPLLHLWSLGIEEQFYVAWPLLLWFAWRRNVAPIVLVSVVAVASFAINAIGLTGHPTATFYSPLSRAWELLAGAALTQIPTRAAVGTRKIASSHASGDGSAWPTLMSLGGIALIIFSATILDSSRPFPGWWALPPVLGSCLLISAGPTAWFNRIVLSSRSFVAIGLISYPLYLWHWPLLTLVRNALPGGDSLFGRLSLLLASLVLAWATYQLIEKPFRYGKRVRPKVFALSTAMAGVAGVAAIMVAHAGFPSRYPEIIQKATEYDLAGYRTALRDKQCFMEPGQDASQFLPSCVDAGTKPLWLLWGDSGAGVLYPGFRRFADESKAFRLAQFTSSACPPILQNQAKINPLCNATNDWVLEKVRALKPDTVVLSAIWGEYDISRLAGTLAAIRQTGVRRIILLGPAPTWKDTPSHIVFANWQADPLHRVPPARLNYREYGLGQDAAPGATDVRASSAEARVRKIAADSGASYISIFDQLCNDNGCLMRQSDKSGDSFYLDIVHLNPRGSDFVIRSISGQLENAAAAAP